MQVLFRSIVRCARGLVVLLLSTVPLYTFAADTLTIGSSNNFPPVNMLDEQGRLQGFGRDLSSAVADAMGLRTRYQHSSRYSEVLQWLEQGRIDLIHDTAWTPQRAEFLDFSDPILEMPEVIFVRPERFDIVDLESLSGKKVACIDQHITHLYLKQFPYIDCFMADTPAEGIYHLVAGDVDAFIFPRQIILFYAHRLNVLDSVKEVGTPLRTLTWSMVVAKGNGELLELLNEGLRRVRASGDYDRIYHHWYGRIYDGGYSLQTIGFAVGGIGAGAFVLFLLLLVRNQRRFNRALQLSEYRLREAQRIASVGNWEWNIENNALHWSDEIYRIFGLKPQQFTATYDAFLARVHPCDRQRVVAAVNASVADGSPYDIDHRILLPDGQERVVREQGEVIFRDGRAVTMTGTVHDITRVKRVEQELTASEEKHRNLSERFVAVLNGIPDAIAEIDRQYTIRWVNDAARFLYGRDPEVITGNHCHHLIADSSEPCSECPVRQVFETSTPASQTKYLSGNRIWEINAVPANFHDSTFDTVIIVGRDVTERTHMQQEAMRAAHLSLMGQLSAGVAHEINNPNNFIMLNTSVLQDIWGDISMLLERMHAHQPLHAGGFTFDELRDEIPQMLSRIHRGSQRIKVIVDHLKEFSSQEKATLRDDVEINQVIRDGLTMMANEIRKHGEQFRLELTDQLPLLRGRGPRLEQVIINLVMNALEATHGMQEEVIVASRFNADTSMVEVTVSDTGCGIEPDTLKHLFEPFFTTKYAAGGTGLGLAICQSIIEEHMGSIRVDSSPGIGTTFTVSLPVSRKAKGVSSEKH
ncbi:PAS sensor protein [Desulfurispirillum indicum S5]|uniref:histidine kinase n=1 Tax=Desulfurispirillum indicum (strain ATCC BAA-1389 / DSM 22839 / S5) TaxID=653733 RepID=E6W4Y9_DESIS|nr:transporter substrate-binding domain-containing protein [Desulfurispirillum indicum]ADU65965.1 PAS sensor protein [Desulfurispirillum indicum S5]